MNWAIRVRFSGGESHLLEERWESREEAIARLRALRAQYADGDAAERVGLEGLSLVRLVPAREAERRRIADAVYERAITRRASGGLVTADAFVSQIELAIWIEQGCP